MTTVTAPWWLWWVLGGLDAAGFTAVCRVAAGWAKQLADWLRRDRVAPLLEDDPQHAWETPCPAREDGIHCEHWYDGQACCSCGDNDPAGLELPPERTWEQMTSHQLPAVVPAPPGHWLNDPPDSERFLRGFWGDHYGQPGEPGYLAPERERRAPEWETDHRQHYAAMGLDYPSGLMARVREAAQ